MLAKKFRLTRSQVLYIKDQARRISHSDFSAQVISNTLNHARFGVVVSRKLSTRAVVRNLLRRRIYSFLAKNTLGNLDILIFPKPTMLKLSYEEIGARINSFLSEIPSLS